MSDDPIRFPGRAEVLRRLGPAKWIHTYRQAGPVLVGADWRRWRVIEAIETFGVENAGPEAIALGHTLVLRDKRGPLFIAAAPEPQP